MFATHSYADRFEGVDPCGSFLLAAAAVWLGHQTVRNRPRARAAGGLAAAAVFLLAAYGGLKRGDSPGGLLVPAAAAAGFVAALVWVALAAGLAVWEGIAGQTRVIWSGLAARAARRRARRESRWEAAERTRRLLVAERQRPELERAAREAEARRSADQRRREDARARVEVYYNLNAPELGGRFTRAMLNEFVSRYMGDDRDPALVEERAAQVTDVMRQHLERVRPVLATQNVEAIIATFADRRRKIAASELDKRDKVNLLIQLDEEQESAVKLAIREGRI